MGCLSERCLQDQGNNLHPKIPVNELFQELIIFISDVSGRILWVVAA